MTVKLVMAELQQMSLERYSKFTREVSYPAHSRSKCDLCIGASPQKVSLPKVSNRKI